MPICVALGPGNPCAASALDTAPSKHPDFFLREKCLRSLWKRKKDVLWRNLRQAGQLIIPKPELGIPLLTMIINLLLVWTPRHFPCQKTPFCGFSQQRRLPWHRKKRNAGDAAVSEELIPCSNKLWCCLQTQLEFVKSTSPLSKKRLWKMTTFFKTPCFSAKRSFGKWSHQKNGCQRRLVYI